MHYYYYYYYFENACEIPDIQEAFKRICLNKMLLDGYCDMSQYICFSVTKGSMYEVLLKQKSQYVPLYYDKNTFPKREKIAEQWHNIMSSNQPETPVVIQEQMTDLDAQAIVHWVYAAFRSRKEKEEFTKAIFSEIKELANIQHFIQFDNGVVYNSKTVSINFFCSLPQIIEFVTKTIKSEETVFYRGHSDANYILLPSIMRSLQLKKNENLLYQEIQVQCPEAFVSCHSHLEKLVKMQHYGLPTRLLDITRNLLVAVYFACESHFESFGELVLLTANQNDIKYPTSDAVTILACLPTFHYTVQQQFAKWAIDPQITVRDFNKKIARLVQEIRIEKPAFEPQIQKEDIQQNYFVHAIKDNRRIIEQNGAFIICGIQTNREHLEAFKIRRNEKKVILLIRNKKQILKELESCSISKATLFPEIECVSEYLKATYT